MYKLKYDKIVTVDLTEEEARLIIAFALEQSAPKIYDSKRHEYAYVDETDGYYLTDKQEKQAVYILSQKLGNGYIPASYIENLAIDLGVQLPRTVNDLEIFVEEK